MWIPLTLPAGEGPRPEAGLGVPAKPWVTNGPVFQACSSGSSWRSAVTCEDGGDDAGEEDEEEGEEILAEEELGDRQAHGPAPVQTRGDVGRAKTADQSERYHLWPNPAP
ncbi:hypothetical protein NDU88_002492 [Pleurodeles waltl]|uniref:Uncharacterized protein n=1 Tax=Pleurodeles waltl TaxID=8319 RepID=A0AAV7Q905_PLEWA|nr:hypothetical protein NDU88_002492 [Pleurodeles waltl]